MDAATWTARTRHWSPERSSSMKEPVPGTPMTRLQLMQQTAMTGSA
jgi:hypothetical protein